MKIVIVGGGLVGSLQAVYMAKRGHEVHLYEGRSDIRTQPRYTGLSINLALSTRGVAALSEVGVHEAILREGLPMHSRMIHAHDGRQTGQAYSADGQAIRSIDRRNLNEHLLTEAEKYDSVHLHFEHKLARADMTKNHLTFNTADGKVEVDCDFIFGCDGAHSQVRKSLMRRARVDFQQFYIPHGYKELTIPPGEDAITTQWWASLGEFQLKPDHLHIWPRSSFMMIALPNLDKTFTATLFMPFDKFDSITTTDDVMQLFQEEFPDAIPLIGETKLVTDYFQNPTGPLMTVKCKPLAAFNTVLLGDSAHAIVPFYGQGMNAGFEDCLFFEQLLKETEGDFDTAVKRYAIERVDDVHAIADLALYNYVEMRDLVNSRWFLFRKKIDNMLHSVLPSVFIPLYTMVTFSQIPYANVINKHKQQSALIDSSLMCAGVVSALGVGLYAAFKLGAIKL